MAEEDELENKSSPKDQKKRPSAREIVGSIFEDTSQPKSANRASALFQPRKPQQEEAPARAAEVSGKGLKQAPEKLRWFFRARKSLRRFLALGRDPVPIITPGEWLDHRRFPVGIDIGLSRIKVVQLAAEGDRWRLVNCAVRPIKGGENLSFSEFTDRARAALFDIFPNRLESLTSVSSFAETQAVTQVIRMPKIPDEEIRQAVAWELQEQFSMRSDDWYFDYAPLGGVGYTDEKEQSVLISAIAKQKLAKHVDMLKSLGLTPIAVEVNPLPVWELLEDYPWPKEQAALLVELGAESSSIIIIVNGAPALIQPISFNGETVTKVIQGILHLSYEDAEVFKCQVGLSCRDPHGSFGDVAGTANLEKGYQAYLAIRPFIDRMIAEMEQVFKYFAFRITHGQIASYSKVVLSGNTAQLKGLKDLMETQLGAPVELAEPFHGVEIDEKTFDRGELEGVALGLSTAIGLAQRGTVDTL